MGVSDSHILSGKNNNGDVIQLGSGIWVGDACWNNNEAVTGLEYKNDGDNFYWRYKWCIVVSIITFKVRLSNLLLAALVLLCSMVLRIL